MSKKARTTLIVLAVLAVIGIWAGPQIAAHYTEQQREEQRFHDDVMDRLRQSDPLGGW